MLSLKELTTYFQEIGADDVKHSSKTYLGHAIGVYNDLKKWGWDEGMARIGLFHSIYGTEYFQGFTLPLERRADIREKIGETAEQIAYLNCALARDHFDEEIKKTSGPFQIHDRFIDQIVDVTDQHFHDLCFLHLCDWIEQVGRAEAWDYRRTAYRNLAIHLGGLALDKYDEAFRNAPEQVWFEEYQWPESSLAKMRRDEESLETR